MDIQGHPLPDIYLYRGVGGIHGPDPSCRTVSALPEYLLDLLP